MKTAMMVSGLLAAFPLMVSAQTAAAAPKKPAPAVVAPAPAAKPAAAPAPKPADTTPQVAAHADFITGSVTVGSGDATRALSSGGEIREHETVVVGPNSYANLRFQDGGHVLLRPDSEFAIESYRYTAAPVTASPAPGVAPATPAPGDSSAFFRLVKGGFRAISGLIGKTDHAAYRVTTPAATIGIRGTDYEVSICTNDCPSQATAQAGGTEVASNDLRGLELAQGGGGPTGGGVIAATHEGSITLRTSRGEFTVDAGHVALALLNGQTFMLPVVPDVMLRNPAPSPESCK